MEKEVRLLKRENSKLSRVTTVILLIILVSSLNAGLTVPEVSAHECEIVHPFLSEEAAKLLPEGSDMRNEIFAYMGDQYPLPIVNDMGGIADGSYEEDMVDWVYSDLTHDLPGILCIPHFWDADKDPPEDRVKNIFGEDDMFPNAYDKACELFEIAMEYYSYTDNPEYGKWAAYTAIGHVAHLLEDMSVPAHVHEDFHPGIADIAGGGDDCFEDWMAENYMDYGAGSAQAQGGIITFPQEIETSLRTGNWRRGLYYLMYTTNQYADYFASDDEDGDPYDKEGWLDYSNWPSSPTRESDLEDNDWTWYGPIPWDNDNNDDGDLSRIALYSVVYCIRAVAGLYKMFYELNHPPTGTMTVQFADHDTDGKADYKWVTLDLTYDVGATAYASDLECRFRNEGDSTWTTWEAVKQRKSWILSEGDGPKIVYYQLRNLMGVQSIEYSASVDLLQTAIPQVFNYEFSATGLDYPVSAQVDFYVTRIWAGTVDFYFDTCVEDGQGNVLLGGEWHQEPGSTIYYECEYGVELDLTNLYYDDVGTRGGWIMPPSEPFDWGNIPIHSVNVVAGQTVRLRTHAYDYDMLSGDDNLETVWTPIYTVPSSSGTYVLANGWFETKGNGQVNEYYSLYIKIIATVTANPWEGYEVPSPNEAAVGYGEPEKWIADASLDLTAPADQHWPYPHTTQWQAHIVPFNPAVEYRMDERSLYARTKYAEPDMTVAILSPIDLTVIDPDGYRVCVQRQIVGLPTNPVFIWEVINEVPGSTVLQTDLDGDGDLDTLIAFDDRKVGDYQFQISPSIGSAPTETASVAISSKERNQSPYHTFPPSPTFSAFLIQDTQLAEIPVAPLLIQSTNAAANLPPAPDANGPYFATEGAEITFDASGSTDPDGDALTYRWDFENDGIWDTGWSSNPTATHIWNDDWAGIVAVEVSDGTRTAIATTSVTVSNAAPTVNAGADQLASPGEEVQFVGSFTDLGVDTHSISWDFGDGTIASGTLTPTHIYSSSRTYTVSLLVTDDDGDVGRDTLTVKTGVAAFIEPAQAIVPAGDDTTYIVVIHNLENIQDSFSIAIDGLDPAWYALETSSVTLNPDTSTQVSLQVFPPNTATIKTYGFSITATSQSDPAVNDFAYADAIVATSHELALEEIPPVTNMIIGEPKYINIAAGKTYVTSATSFTLTAEDNVEGTGVASTFYYIYNSTYDTGRLEYKSPFYLLGLSDGQYAISYYSKDNVANKEEATTESVILDNTPPAVVSMSANPNPALITTPITLLALLDDTGVDGSMVVSAEYSIDSGPWVPMESVDGNFDEVVEEATAGIGSYATPDVLNIAFRATDALGNTGSPVSILLAVYDPNAGFVTGGGWINSPIGAYAGDPTLTGKATVSFVSKYQKGANIPSGNMEFHFNAADLMFKMESCQWLVLAAPRFQFKGTGTIKGLTGEYDFMLTALDGHMRGGDGLDYIRVKIWEKATGIIIYDSEMGASDIGNPTLNTEGGNVAIQNR
jgi:PKD repeat protein